LLVVVDDEDRMLGHVPRAECHADATLRHRSIHVVVECEGGLLLQRRGFAKDMAAGLWDSACSGHVQPGESYLDAAVRELEEELGIRAEPEFLGTCHVAGVGEIELCGVHTLQHQGPFVLRPPELVGVCVFRRDELPAPLTPALVQVLEWLAGKRRGSNDGLAPG
jgi:isopentenyl-diphosphate delta-isomerase